MGARKGSSFVITMRELLKALLERFKPALKLIEVRGAGKSFRKNRAAVASPSPRMTDERRLASASITARSCLLRNGVLSLLRHLRSGTAWPDARVRPAILPKMARWFRRARSVRLMRTSTTSIPYSFMMSEARRVTSAMIPLRLLETTSVRLCRPTWARNWEYTTSSRRAWLPGSCAPICRTARDR